MRYNFREQPRKKLRLKGYNYSSLGYYFVTLCTERRLCLFGDIKFGEMLLSEAGQMIFSICEDISKQYETVKTYDFIVMPNHVHAIIGLTGTGPAQRPAPTVSLPMVIANFKSYTTHKYSRGIIENRYPGYPKRLWQRGYYEHIVRNQEDFNRIRKYILDNPLQWERDKHNLKF